MFLMKQQRQISVLSKVDVSVAVVSSGTSDVVVVVIFVVNVPSVLSKVDVSVAVVSSGTSDVQLLMTLTLR
jgi:NCAIR mutase (PurE)-related protein